MDFAAVRLFLDRAAAVRPGFTLAGSGDAVSVCRICRRYGEKLMLKGDKCVTKCTLDKRATPPGVCIVLVVLAGFLISRGYEELLFPKLGE